MKRNYTGYFISLEGGEKVGKTTQARNLADYLRGEGREVVITREPGGTALGEEIRNILLNPKWSLSKATEMLLFFADRAQHYKEVVKPALKDGKVVICDRYIDSSLVYQGYTQGWQLGLLFRLHNVATGMLMPDLTFILDGEAMSARSEDDTYERKKAEYHQKIRENYLHLAQKHPRYVLVPANLPLEEVSQTIIRETMVRMRDRMKRK